MKKKEILCIILLYFAASVGLIDSLNPLALYGAIPLSFLISLSVGNSLKTNNYLKRLLVLILWVAVTYFSAVYVEEANNQMKNLLGVFVLSMTIANLSSDKRCVPWLYGVFIILLIQALVYAHNHIMIDGFDTATDRLDDEKLNANTVAYYTFFVTVAIYELGNSFLIKSKLIVNIFRLLFLAMYGVSFMVAILTGSRQVLIIQIPLLALLTFIRYIEGTSLKRKLLFVLIAAIACVASIGPITKSYDNSYLKVRSETKAKDDVRALLLQDAIKVGCQHPILGVGPGNYVRYSFNRHFSHCTYTELFANTGVIGALIYVSLVLMFITSQWKRFWKYRDKTYLVFFVCGLIYLFDNFFYVFYVDLWLIGFFILLASHSETYFNYKKYNYETVGERL